MKILFPIKENNSLDSYVAADFATAPMFFWYYIDTGEYGCIDNDGCDENDGGKSAVESAAETGSEAVIAIEIGCAAVNRLRGKQADTYASKGGTVGENVELFKSGSLRRVFAGECDGSCKV